jgi:flagellar basal-body rod protein FlgG
MATLAADIAATGIQVGDQALQISANNLANQMSDGFKKSDPVFTNIVYEKLVSTLSGTTNPGEEMGVPPLQAGTGVRLAGVSRDLRMGLSDPTKNKYDISINGEGYLQVDLGNNQTGYTRMGHLKLDDQGTLRTITDYPLMDNITIDSTQFVDFHIDKTGRVVGKDPQGAYQEIGQLTLWNFVNPQGLEDREDTVYVSTPASGQATQGNPGESGFGTIMQGYIERSNVDGPRELVRAVVAHRYTTSNAAMLRMAQQMENDTVKQISSVS